MPLDELDRPSKILVIDDTPANVLLLQTILKRSGYEVITCTQPTQAMALFEETKPDLILLDLHMPEVDGYQLLKAFREVAPDANELPILVFTADVTPEAALRALELGASDFLTKPGIVGEIILRVRNFLSAHHLYQQLQVAKNHLEEKVKERTKALWESQVEVVERLAKLGERRDDRTGSHCQRVGDYSAQIAAEWGLPHMEVELIRMAAPLHDIGKVGIPDNILLKRGMLSEAELDIMRTHPEIGRQILSGGRTPLIQMAETIAVSHHEKWDGTGYPNRLRGEEIPVAGRIVAIADVYDSLTSERSYKRAMSHLDSMLQIQAGSGTHFDPDIVLAFMRAAPLGHCPLLQAA